MNTYLSIFLISALVASLQAIIVYNPPTKLSFRAGQETWNTYSAKVDNYNLLNMATYDQRYLSNAEHAKASNPPIIIYVGGEWEIKEGELTGGQLNLMAQENDAALFYLEHRFYGKSMPKKDYTTKNLQLLSSKQAMSDLVGFVKMLKKQGPYKKSKVILFGCSYSATLTSWTKHDYPELITGIYVTSGPLLAKADMNEFLERATLVMNLVDRDCADIIKAGVQQLQAWYVEDKGDEKVRKKLGYCKPATSNEPYDKMAIFEYIAAYFGNMVQTSLPTYQTQCRKLKKITGDNKGDILASFLKESNDTCIHRDYTSTLKSYAETSTKWGSLRPFFYMQCTIFGWFVTTNNPNQIFGDVVTTDFYFKLCGDSFNNTVTSESIEAAIDATNQKYGGQKPTISNAAFAYGGLDPWQPMGLSANFSDTTAVYYIGSGGHCHDMFQPLASDGDDMAQAKIDLRAQVKKFLQQ